MKNVRFLGCLVSVIAFTACSGTNIVSDNAPKSDAAVAKIDSAPTPSSTGTSTSTGSKTSTSVAVLDSGVPVTVMVTETVTVILTATSTGTNTAPLADAGVVVSDAGAVNADAQIVVAAADAKAADILPAVKADASPAATPDAVSQVDAPLLSTDTTPACREGELDGACSPFAGCNGGVIVCRKLSWTCELDPNTTAPGCKTDAGVKINDTAPVTTPDALVLTDVLPVVLLEAGANTDALVASVDSLPAIDTLVSTDTLVPSDATPVPDALPPAPDATPLLNCVYNGAVVAANTSTQCLVGSAVGSTSCVNGQMTSCVVIDTTVATLDCVLTSANIGTVTLTGDVYGNMIQFVTGTTPSSIGWVCIVGDSIGGEIGSNTNHCKPFNPDPTTQYVWTGLSFAGKTTDNPTGENRMTFTTLLPNKTTVAGWSDNRGGNGSTNGGLVFSTDPNNRCLNSNAIIAGGAANLVFAVP